MKTSSGFLVAAVVLLTASLSQAKDLCIFYASTGGNVLVVVKRYASPRPGDCKPIQGFVADTVGTGRRQTLSGTACLNSAGSVLIVSHQVHSGSTANLPPPLTSYWTGWRASVELDTPFMNSGLVRIDDESGGGGTISSAHAQTCIGRATLP